MEHNVLDTIDKATLGQRLQQARLKKQLSLIEVEEQAGSPVTHLAGIEQGLIGIGPHELMTLAHLYGMQIYQLVNPLPEGLSRDDILGMLEEGEISEGVAACELEVDLLDLRILVEKYQQAHKGEEQ